MACRERLDKRLCIGAWPFGRVLLGSLWSYCKEPWAESQEAIWRESWRMRGCLGLSSWRQLREQCPCNRRITSWTLPESLINRILCTNSLLFGGGSLRSNGRLKQLQPSFNNRLCSFFFFFKKKKTMHLLSSDYASFPLSLNSFLLCFIVSTCPFLVWARVVIFPVAWVGRHLETLFTPEYLPSPSVLVLEMSTLFK